MPTAATDVAECRRPVDPALMGGGHHAPMNGSLYTFAEVGEIDRDDDYGRGLVRLMVAAFATEALLVVLIVAVVTGLV
jgi:hypothetical protein